MIFASIRRALFRGKRSVYPHVHRTSAVLSAVSAYKFLIREFWPLARLLLAPIVAAGLVLYISLDLYVSGLLRYIDSPNPRVASFALGVLAAGLFLSLFCYTVAVAAVIDLDTQKSPAAGLRFKAERQEWRLYAAYLRFLLVLCAALVGIYFLSAYILPLFASQIVAGDAFGVLSITVAYVLFARVAFVIAPVVATSDGPSNRHDPVLRKAWLESADDLGRNMLLIFLLLVPGLLVQVGGEYLWRVVTHAPRLTLHQPIGDYARIMDQSLAGFLTVASLSIFVTITLLTAGAMALYRNRAATDPFKNEPHPAGLRTKPGSLQAEALPE